MEFNYAVKDVRTLNLLDAKSKSERGSTPREKSIFETPFLGFDYPRERIIASSKWRVRSRTCSNALKCVLGTWPKPCSIAAQRRTDRPFPVSKR
mgnify:CR=1 FL=1